MRRAMAAQSGLGFGGTTADILAESEALAELDALNLAYSGASKARSLQAQAGLSDYYGRVASQNARGARMAGFMGAGMAGLGLMRGGQATPPQRSLITGYGSTGLRPGGGLGLRPGGGIGLRY